MSISSQTSIQAYQLKKGGTPARMAILRMIAADSVNNRNPDTRLQPGDWRGARHTSLKSYEAYYGTLDQGADGKEPIWYASAEQFRNETDAHEIRSTDHTGWYCDPDGSSLCIGIVASLTHGRFIAGYRLSDSGMRTYFNQIFDDASDAARMADEHARIIGENEFEYRTRWREAQDLNDEIAEHFTRLHECLALRHRKCMEYVRNEISEIIETIRINRDTLAAQYADIEV